MSSGMDVRCLMIGGMLSDRIKEIMQAKRWTQADVARAAKVGRQTVTLWVNGTTQNLTIASVKPLARASGFSADYIATGEGIKRGAASLTLINGTKPRPEIDLDLLRDSISGVELFLKEERRHAQSDKKASLVALVYEHSMSAGKVDAGAVRRILRLVS